MYMFEHDQWTLVGAAIHATLADSAYMRNSYRNPDDPVKVRISQRYEKEAEKANAQLGRMLISSISAQRGKAYREELLDAFETLHMSHTLPLEILEAAEAKRKEKPKAKKPKK